MPKYLDSKYDLAANTYIAKEQSFAVCEVGDAKQPTAFYPQVKIMRWDNECNFSARLVHKETSPKVALVADKVQWIGDAVEAHFYEVGDGKEGGGYEFEIILKEPPKSNVISMTIQTKGLEFFYQPPLTIEEIRKGTQRPENVVGSYAVYHKTMAGDFTALGGKNYLAGKAFHIFRPRIEDAKGNWVWGDLNIDEKAGILTVTIPQDFLEKAIYPVRHAAGLEFGYHTQGGSWDNQGPSVSVGFRTAAVTPGGVLSKITTYLYANSGNTSPWYVGLYNEGSTYPTSMISQVGYVPSNTSAVWTDSPTISGNIVNGSLYWIIGGKQGGYSGNIFVAFDMLGTGFWHVTVVPFGDPYPAGATPYGYQHSQYVTYAPSAAGQATAKRFGGIPHMAINKGVW